MAKGPSYTEEEQKLLLKLAKKGGSPTVLAKEFLATMPGDRSETALVQKIRKMILESQAEGDPDSVPAKKPRAAKVNVAPVSDAREAPGSTRVRKPASFIPPMTEDVTASANGHHGNGNGNSNPKSDGITNLEVVSVDLGGLRLIGTRKLVGAALQQLA